MIARAGEQEKPQSYGYLKGEIEEFWNKYKLNKKRTIVMYYESPETKYRSKIPSFRSSAKMLVVSPDPSKNAILKSGKDKKQNV